MQRTNNYMKRRRTEQRAKKFQVKIATISIAFCMTFGSSGMKTSDEATHLKVN